MLQKYPFLASSANPEKLSMTIKGLLTGLVVVLSAVGVIPADAIADVSPIADGIVTTVQTVLAALAALWTLWGALRKVGNKWFK